MLNLDIQRNLSPQCRRFHLPRRGKLQRRKPPTVRNDSPLATTRKEGSMPRFLIERNFAEEVEMTKDDVDRVNRINDETGVKWLISFLSADKKKTYCLYEAPSAEAIRLAAKRANVPADVIIEVTRELSPTMFD